MKTSDQVEPVAISVKHLAQFLDLSIPAAYKLADAIGAVRLSGFRATRRVPVARISEHLGPKIGDAIIDSIRAKNSGPKASDHMVAGEKAGI